MKITLGCGSSPRTPPTPRRAGVFAAAAVLCLALVSPVAARAGAAQTVSEPAVAGAAADRAPQPPFRVGEVLTYSIAYAFVDAGTLRLAVEGVEEVRGRPAYHLTSRAQTNSSISALYSLTDNLQSWLDTERLVSLRYVRQAVEKGKKREKYLTFDQERHVKIFENKGEEKAIAPNGLDDVAILYYLRTLPLEDGKTFTLNNLADPEDNPMKVTVLGKEKVKVPAGTFDCYAVRLGVHTDSGIFSQGAEIKGWMTRDDRHLLVKLQSKLSVGSFTVQLTGFQPGGTAPVAEAAAAQGGSGPTSPSASSADR